MYDFSNKLQTIDQASPPMDPILQRFKSERVEINFRKFSEIMDRDRRIRSYHRISPSIRNRDSAYFNIISTESTRCDGVANCRSTIEASNPTSLCGRRILEPSVVAYWQRQRKREERNSKRNGRRSNVSRVFSCGDGVYNIINNEDLPQEGGYRKASSAWEILQSPSKNLMRSV